VAGARRWMAEGASGAVTVAWAAIKHRASWFMSGCASHSSGGSARQFHLGGHSPLLSPMIKVLHTLLFFPPSSMHVRTAKFNSGPPTLTLLARLLRLNQMLLSRRASMSSKGLSFRPVVANLKIIPTAVTTLIATTKVKTISI
jgi:hypothetical protein